MIEFFAVFMPPREGERINVAITGETTEEVMAKAQAIAPDVAPYYLFAIRTRHDEVEGGFVWVTGEDWNLEAFDMHVNPPASEE